MKKFVSATLLVVMLVSILNISALAATPGTVEPRWANTGSITENMIFDGTSGTVAIRATGKVGVNRIEGSCVIYKHVGSDWVYVTEDSKTVNAMSCYLEIPFTAEIGYEYKAEYTFIVYKNGVGETIESSFTRVCE